MPWILNTSRADVENGKLGIYYAARSAVLIRILDTGTYEPKPPADEYHSVHTFRFLDVESTDDLADFGITEDQAIEIVNILKHALVHNLNVVVHCTVGHCRSGAVAEIGVMMGFSDLKRYRSPNVMVKTALMKHLGWSYENE